MARRGWTSLFGRKEIEEATAEKYLPSFLEGVARILQAGTEGQALDDLRAEIKRLFDCEDITLYATHPDELPGVEEGQWVLTAKHGVAEGSRVFQTHANTMPSLVPGKRFPFSDQLSSKAILKTVALAFQDDAFYGCDIEKKIVLLRDPKPEDDQGSGDLSVLAIPLNYENKVGRVLEKTRVGVLVLYNTPIQRMQELETFIRAVVGQAITQPSCLLRDPVTTLYTEQLLKEQLAVYMNMLQITDGKLRGGLVVGMIDALKVYKQTLETEANVNPGLIGQHVSEVLRGVGSCVWRRARDHSMAAGADYKCGTAGRVGHEGFGVLLPLLKAVDLRMWAVKLSRDVIEYDFPGEEYLVTGDVTVSLRVIPFGHKGATNPTELWRTATEALEAIETAQIKARRDPATLKNHVGKILSLLEDGTWSEPGEYKTTTGRL